MRIRYTTCLLVYVLLASTPSLAESRRVGTMDFYGLGKVTEEQVRSSLGFSEGDVLPDSMSEAQQRLNEIPGVFRAHLQTVCCGENGFVGVYVGIDESGAMTLQYRQVPRTDIELPRKIVRAYSRFWKAFDKAIRAGDTSEDLSEGHSLMNHPGSRAAQERFLVLADKRLNELRRVLHKSADSGHRAAAAYVIGYAPDKRSVVGDLLDAVRDPDETVRNNATRSLAAIAELAGSRPELGIRIDPTIFIDMLNSVVWTDRNKASMILRVLAEGGDATLMQQIRDRALTSLVEMARWKSLGHAGYSFFLLGRMAGMTDEEVEEALVAGERDRLLERILAALH